MTILERAQRLRSRYGTTDPAKILEQMRIPVLECHLTGLRGIYKQVRRNTIIIVDSSLSEHDRRFVLGHELAHHLLHRGENRMFLERCTYLKTSRYEDEADLFSLCLMAPDPTEFVYEGCTVSHVAARLGVSLRLAQMYVDATLS